MSSRKILVIEDDAPFNKFISRSLEMQGYKVFPALNGQEGLDLAFKHVPDLIITDGLLPKLSGLQICKTVREAPTLKHIPVLLMTGVYRSSRFQTEMSLHGVDALIRKPFEISALISQVNKLLPQETSAVETSVTDEMTRLKEEYAATVPGKVQTLRSQWGRLKSHWDLEKFKEVHRELHSLDGSSATFELTHIQDHARALHVLSGEILDASQPPSIDQIRKFDEMLSRFSKGEAAPAPPAGASPAPGKAIPSAEANEWLVYVLGNPSLAAPDVAQINHYGYRPRFFGSFAEVIQAVRQSAPALVMIDLSDRTEFRPEIPQDLLSCKGTPLPVVFLSDQDDMASRLSAVRAGGKAYFARPIDVAAMVNTLDNLTEHRFEDPYRILIVEDEYEVAARHALILHQAGMVTEVVTKPLEILDVIREFRPDLLLMDLYMPGCDGIEIASVVRQQDEFISLPIVFLSVETSLKKQTRAIETGGEEFLAKPVLPEVLVPSVTARAHRSRLIRSFMMRDGLTGLLNHSAIQSQIQIEADRSRRLHTKLSFVMIDIDNFKSINDTHGHPVGDRVLKSLARLMNQRIRRTDVLGRYGGDEMAAILIGTDRTEAAAMMDEIRVTFSKIAFKSPRGSFTCSISCGVSSLTPDSSASILVESADRALYEAKKQGRNRTCTA